ncbi:hypothetical protein BS78_05G266800 [Paspalum vaginatum]|nr:hypothetical protein BS78_05G266800 [Paspalum vaginatum]
MAQVLCFLLAPVVSSFLHLVPTLTPVAAATSGPAPAPQPVGPASADPIVPSPGSAATSAPAPAPLPPSSADSPRSGCPSKCGNLNIPYPFGIDSEHEICSWHGLFSLTCNTSFNPPRLYAGNVIVLNISLEDGQMVVGASYSQICHNDSSNGTTETHGVPKYIRRHVADTETSSETTTTLDLTNNTPYLISGARNEFTAIGCNTEAYLQGREDWSYYTGCITYCVSLEEAAQDGEECAGLGCCQTSILGNLTVMQVSWKDPTPVQGSSNPASSNDISTCSYAFVAEKGWYNFSRQDISTDGADFTTRYGEQTEKQIRLVLDWAIRDNGSCLLSGATPESATASAPGDGYLCNCSQGYTGNPYVANGCRNINECELSTDSCGSASTCHDRPGDYVCKCNFGYRGNGKSEKGCQPIIPVYAFAIIATSVSALLACFMIIEVKKRKQRIFFDKNGGEILERMGAFGKVFFGIIGGADEKRVAVKCATLKAETLPKEEFVNEITFQFRVSHENLVRLVGCCLETPVPMLVFEFVPNGSLYNMLHGGNKRTCELPLLTRLEIAIGSAEALSYMHSHGGNHVHGDVKSGNILLDQNLTPKVSDFGSSKLVSVAGMYSKWCVSGDMSYIDPVYLKSGRFTEKSDVYSFGVVLLELITRKTAKYGDNSLPLEFVKCCKEYGNGRKMYDKDIVSADDSESKHYMECLDRIGELAVRCLNEDLDERSTMREVVRQLKQVKLIACG